MTLTYDNFMSQVKTAAGQDTILLDALNAVPDSVFRSLFDVAKGYAEPVARRIQAGESPDKLMVSLKGSGLQTAVVNDFQKTMSVKTEGQAAPPKEESGWFESAGDWIQENGRAALASVVAAAALVTSHIWVPELIAYIYYLVAGLVTLIMSITLVEGVMIVAVLLVLYLMLEAFSGIFD